MNDSVAIVLRALSAAAAILVAAYFGFELLLWLSRRVGDRFPILPKLLQRARKPVRFLVGIVAARVVSMRIAHLREGWVDTLDHVLQIGTIVAIIWLAVAAIGAIEDRILKNDLKKNRDPVDRRRVETQVTLLRRLIVAVLVGVGVVAVLMTFPSVRALGASILASAGLISIIAGLAAQTSLTNVFAGIQLALSDSVRVGDVIVANEATGIVSQLTLTHVELRLWDGRVLILPSSFFISQPFENWTRTLNQIGGSVFIDVDWGAPVDAVRTEVTRLLEASELWDGRRNFVFVADTTGTTRRLQIGVSAANTNDLFALQSLVREKITEFLFERHPESLVRNRVRSLDSAESSSDLQPAPARPEPDRN